jgi:hypothetical protein
MNSTKLKTKSTKLKTEINKVKNKNKKLNSENLFQDFEKSWNKNVFWGGVNNFNNFYNFS